MISIKKDFNDIPAILLSGDENAWQHKSVLTKLKELYHGKCAYCETKAKDLKTEHYRPKSLYPWLANEWSNLLPICSECNKAKAGEFPINGKRITEAPKDKNEWKVDSEILLSELPQIIHPEVDTAENHFYFEKNGLIQGFTDRGKKTVSTLKLYREFLNNKRKILYDKYFYRLKKSKDEFDESYFDDLLKETEKENEFSLLGIQMFYQFKSFLLNAVDSEIMQETFNPYSNEIKITKNALNIFNLYIHKLLEIKPNETIDSIIPFGIRSFFIYKFQGIKELHIKYLPVNTQWIFLTGENGFGKTSILRAILLGLIGKKEFREEEIDENTRVVLKMIKPPIEFKQGNEELYKQQINEVDVNIFGSHIHVPHTKAVAAFGAVRTFLNPTGNKIPISANLFAKDKTDDLYVINIENFLEKIDDLKYRYISDKIKNCIKTLVPNLADIRVVYDTDINKIMTLYYEKDENGNILPPVRFEQLAMGMRGVIGMIGDIIQRLTNIQNLVGKDELISDDLNNPFKGFEDLIGIVLIDEFDNHLHPKWQIMLVEKLTKLFPKVQFIVSTHSILPIMGAPENSVFMKVNRTAKEGITVEKIDFDREKLSPNILLTSPLFDTPLFRENFPTHDDYIKWRADKEVDKELQKMHEEEQDFFKQLDKITQNLQTND